MTNKKEWVLKAFKGEHVDRVPVGFWHHFTQESEWGEGFNNPTIFEKNVAGHKKFIEEVNPDFVKLMSDGFFQYPNPLISTHVRSVNELRDIASIGEDHEWFNQQVELIKTIKSDFPEEIASFYNIFAPVTYLKWQLADKVSDGDDCIADFIKEDAELTRHVLNVIAKDISVLVKKVITEAGADGIYLSVQNLQDERIDKEDYLDVVKPSELAVLNAAIDVSGVNILHICGYEGASNDVSYYTDYPADVINWAVGPEGINLSEGRQLFGGKTVLGGFVNTKEGLLYTGTKDDIQKETKMLLDEAGKQGVIIGADCTIPSDIAPERIQWVREAVSNIK